MPTPTLERLERDVSPEKLIEVLDRDGCAVVEGALTPAQLEGLNDDLDALIEATTISPAIPEPWQILANVYLELGDEQGAQQASERLQRLLSRTP